MSSENEDESAHLRFLNYLVNDCIYLLDEAMKALPDLKTTEARLLEDLATNPRQRTQLQCGATYRSAHQTIPKSLCQTARPFDAHARHIYCIVVPFASSVLIVC